MIHNLKNRIQAVPQKHLAAARAHLDTLTKPLNSLGRLEEIAARFIAIRGDQIRFPLKKRIFVFAADHGVAREGVSAYPQEVTAQMVANFINGGAAINVLSRHTGADTTVVDMGVIGDLRGLDDLRHAKIAQGTDNFTEGPAMTQQQAEASLQAGFELAEEFAHKGCDLFATGEMGIGNTTASTAILSVVSNKSPTAITGRGTGIDESSLQTKIGVITKAIEVNAPDRNDPLDILSKLGGFEIGGMTGFMLGAAAHKVPVVADGLISATSAVLASMIASEAKDYLFMSHRSQEPGHQVCFDHLNMQPYLDLEMRLGEGTGAALAMNLIEASVKIYKQMATFESAGVSKKPE